MAKNIENALIIWIVHFFVWNAFAAFFAISDYREWFKKYKIARDHRISYLKILPTALFNQIFVMLPVMLFIDYFDFGFGNNHHPWWILILHAYALGIIHDIVFYFGHRLLHTKIGFKKLRHYIHHESQGGTAAASLYMSPSDFFIEIVAPYMTFILIFPTNFYFNCLLASIGSVAAMYEHSGYCFTTWSPLDTRPHISHHGKRINASFSEGVLSPGWCDKLSGSSFTAREKEKV